MKRISKKIIMKLMWMVCLHAPLMGMKVYAGNDDSYQRAAENKKLLELPIRFMIPESLYKSDSNFPQVTQEQHQNITKEYLHDLVGIVNIFFKNSKIRTRYSVHSINFLKAEDYQKLGIDDNGQCSLNNTLNHLRRSFRLIQVAHQHEPKKIASTVVGCNVSEYGFAGLATMSRLSKKLKHSDILLDMSMRADRAAVLAHELGHAWGLLHTEDWQTLNVPDGYEQAPIDHELKIMNAVLGRYNKQVKFSPEQAAYINNLVDEYINNNERYYRLNLIDPNQDIISAEQYEAYFLGDYFTQYIHPEREYSYTNLQINKNEMISLRYLAHLDLMLAQAQGEEKAQLESDIAEVELWFMGSDHLDNAKIRELKKLHKLYERRTLPRSRKGLVALGQNVMMLTGQTHGAVVLYNNQHRSSNRSSNRIKLRTHHRSTSPVSSNDIHPKYDDKQRLFSGKALIHSGVEKEPKRVIHLHVSRKALAGKKILSLSLLKNWGHHNKQFSMASVVNLKHYGRDIVNYRFSKDLLKNRFKTLIHDRNGEIRFEFKFKLKNHLKARKVQVVIHVED
jgi:hypothetical protein